MFSGVRNTLLPSTCDLLREHIMYPLLFTSVISLSGLQFRPSPPEKDTLPYFPISQTFSLTTPLLGFESMQIVGVAVVTYLYVNATTIGVLNESLPVGKLKTPPLRIIDVLPPSRFIGLFPS